MPSFVDYSRPDRLRSALTGFVDDKFQRDQSAVHILQGRAKEEAANKVVTDFFAGKPFEQPPDKILGLVTEAGAKLGTIGGQQGQAGAKSIFEGLDTWQKLQPKVKPPSNLNLRDYDDPKDGNRYRIGVDPVTNEEKSRFLVGPTPKTRVDPREGAGAIKAIADSKRNLAKAQKTINEFESNPVLVQNYQKIVKDPEFAQAVEGGDVDLATAIIAKLAGDTTPQKVLSKRYLDYIKAVNDEEGEFAYLKEFGEDTKALTRKKSQPERGKGY